jgi:hypothetical protein
MHLKKPFFRRTDFSPSWTHKSDSLPNFGVNTPQCEATEVFIGTAFVHPKKVKVLNPHRWGGAGRVVAFAGWGGLTNPPACH